MKLEHALKLVSPRTWGSPSGLPSAGLKPCPTYVLLIGLAAAAATFSGCSRDPVPTAPVTRGEFVEWLQLQGEVKASRSITLRAPAEAGQLRIVKLVPNGTTVKEGTVIAEFDTSTVGRTLDEKRTEVNGFQADIEKAQADATAQRAEAVTAESTARFDVERARLDYSGREVLSRVEAEQMRLKILDAEQKLREATAKLASVQAQAQANLAAATQKRAKAQRDFDRAQAQLGSLRITASASGILNIMHNPQSPFTARQLFKPGDQVWPGAEIARLPDPSSLYITSRVDEVERGRLAVDQRVSVRAEALPDRELRAHVQSISALAKADFSSWPPPRNFDLTCTLEDEDPRLRPGVTTTLRIAAERLADAIMVPAEAVFGLNGQEVVYVLVADRLEPRVIEIDRRNEDRVVVRRGVTPGERVALVDPTAERTTP